MSERKKILVVDDEPQIVRVMRQILAAHQFDIRSASDGEAGIELFHDWKPDLIITDLQMPNVGGLQLCRKIRELSEVPIVVLSVKDDEKTIVEALDAGADDYVTKPFGTNELLARIRAALRRLPEKTETVLETGDFSIDFSAHKVSVEGREIHLTPKEFELLAFLLKNPEKVLTHQILLQNVWGAYYTESPEALRVLVGSLRKKIEKDFSKPKYILTEPWIGYRFIPMAETQA
ncbi:MAG: response regulator transcription factor [Acidobacteriota bacterium]|nr:response regulator transcription factor [Acidobacteriota bacterium]